MGKFCGHCGAPIKEESAFCGKCGKAVNCKPTADTRGKPAPGSSHRRDSENKRKKKAPLFLGCLAAAVVLVVLGIFAFTQLPSFFAPQDTEQTKEAGEAVSDSAFVQLSSGMPSILLLMDETDFITGSESFANVTVRYDDSIQDEINILDEKGNSLVTIRNDGSGTGEAKIRIDTATDSVFELTAVCGTVNSNSVTCYVHPEITMEMVHRLADVAGDMAEFIDAQNFSEPFGAEAIQTVADYLRRDSRVKTVKQGKNCLLYYTVDSLVGAYSAGECEQQDTKNCFGSGVTTVGQSEAALNHFSDYSSAARMLRNAYSDPDETFEEFLQGGDTSYRTLNSKSTMTNNKVISMIPTPNDRVIGYEIDNSHNELNLLANTIGGEHQEFLSTEARRMIETGGFADCGFLYLLSHGKYLFGQFSFSLCILNMDEFLRTEWDDTYTKLWCAEVYQQTLDPDVFGPTKIRLYYNYSGEGRSSLCGTTYYIAEGLRDQIFDNTIVYNGCCYGHRDENLVQLFIDHGASAYIGTNSENDFVVNRFIINTLCRSLSNGQTIEDCMNKYNNVTPKDFHELQLPEEEYSDEIEITKAVIYDAIPENRVHFDVDSEQRNLWASGSLSGKVVSLDNEPLKDAVVHLYRWLNHEFVEQTELLYRTDRDGNFSFDNLKCGIYGITAEFTLVDGSTVEKRIVKEVTEPEYQIEDMVLDCHQVCGVVKEKNSGKLISNTPLTIDISDWARIETATNGTGDFSFYVSPNTINLQCSCENYNIWKSGEIHLPTQPITILLEKETISICGNVQDQDTRAPIANAKVWLTEQGQKAAISETMTDEAGRFELECKPGVYRVYASADGYGESDPVEVTVTGAEPDGTHSLSEPILLKEALVYTVYSEEFPGNNYFKTMLIEIPAVNLDTPEAIELNNRMYNALYPYVFKKDRNVGYSWEVVKNVLTINVCTTSTYYSSDVTVYTLILSDGNPDGEEQTTRQKLLAAVNLTEEEFCKLARRRAAEIWDNKEYQAAMDVTIGMFGASSQPEWDKAREMTLSDKNLQDAVLSFHDCNLSVRMRFYYPEFSQILSVDYVFIIYT